MREMGKKKKQNQKVRIIRKRILKKRLLNMLTHFKNGIKI